MADQVAGATRVRVAVKKAAEAIRAGTIETQSLIALLKDLDPSLSEARSQALLDSIRTSDEGMLHVQEFLDGIMGPMAPTDVSADDFKPCSLSSLTGFDGLFAGISTEEQGSVTYEMVVDTQDFAETDNIIDGIVHWKCLGDEAFWYGKRASEFVRGQVSSDRIFRIAGFKCNPPEGMIECCVYVLQLSQDGLKLHGMFQDGDGPFVLQRLSEVEASAWRVARLASPDCDNDGNAQQPSCPAGHILEKSAALMDDHPCDMCRKGQKCGSVMFGCTPCFYDLCSKCVDLAVKK